MLTGKQLGDALAKAMALKDVSPAQVAEHFGIKAPSVYDWVEYGRIGKKHIPGPLVAYFIDVVPASHWGITEADGPIPLFTPERRASDDVIALQVALESLAVAVFQKTPGAAAAFLADLDVLTTDRKFSKSHALLGRLDRTAEQVHRHGATQGPKQPPARPARRTKT